MKRLHERARSWSPQLPEQQICDRERSVGSWASYYYLWASTQTHF